MPNTSPACDLPETVHYIKQTARQASAHVYPIAAATRSLAGEELTDLRSLHSAGAVAVSDDGRPVATAALMKTVMETAAALGVPVLAHCEELSLVQGGIMNEGTVSRSLGVPGISVRQKMSARQEKSLWQPLPAVRSYLSCQYKGKR